MAYDDVLAERVRELLQAEKGLSEMRMFGGLAFLINGNMAVAASGQGGLLLRIDPEQTESLIDAPHIDRFVMRGRPMDGWLRLDRGAVPTEAALAKWVERGVSYAKTLPPKKDKKT